MAKKTMRKPSELKEGEFLTYKYDGEKLTFTREYTMLRVYIGKACFELTPSILDKMQAEAVRNEAKLIQHGNP